MQPRLRVAALLLSVNPAVAKRYIERFRIRHGRLLAALLENTQPEPRRSRVIFSQPSLKLGRAREGNHRLAVGRSEFCREMLRFEFTLDGFHPRDDSCFD